MLNIDNARLSHKIIWMAKCIRCINSSSMFVGVYMNRDLTHIICTVLSKTSKEAQRLHENVLLIANSVP